MAADTRTTAGPSPRQPTREWIGTAIGPSTFGWPRQRVARWALLLPVMMALLLAGDAAPGQAPAWTALPAAQPLALSLLLLCAGGMLSGLLAGLLGIGGALITIPALHLALPTLGIDAAHVPATAVATALMAMVPITLVAALQQQRHGAIELDWLRRMAGPMACGAAGGAVLAATLNGPVLVLLFALQSCWYGARLLLDRCGVDARSDGAGTWQRFAQLPPWVAAPPMAAFCACVGMGGGSIVTPFLLRQRMPFRHAVATAGALNLCIALAGSLAFAVFGGGASSAAACVPAAVLLASGAMVAVKFGVSLAHRVPAVSLQRLIGIVNLVSALTLVCQLVLR
jgi:uncharacterized membrane protein YfcA